MNGTSRTPIYIGFGALLVAFFVILNGYYALKADIAENNNTITELQRQLNEQAKPCQPEDLIHPELSAGCTIQPTQTSSGTPSGGSQPGTQPQPTSNNSTTNFQPPSGGTPPPSPTPPEEPPSIIDGICELPLIGVVC